MNKLTVLIISVFFCSLVSAEPSSLKPIDQYYAYASSGEWQKALPIIRSLIEDDPNMPSRWFQYGTCLEELKHYSEAINAFTQAYVLDATDFGAQYRIFRNYALAGDSEGFVSFAREEVVKTPQIIELIGQREEFGSIVASIGYQKFLDDLAL